MDKPYPRFYENRGDLIAILKPNRMFHLKVDGFGKGRGFEFRIYVTRSAVLKYDAGKSIKFEEFQRILQSVFHKYLVEINELLPKGFLEANNNKKLDNKQKQIS